MTSYSVPRSLREEVRQRAGFRCEYCLTAEWLNGIESEIDHIIPRSTSGTSDSSNLCLAGTSCNGYKQARSSAVDPNSGEIVSLFNPRLQQWHAHFTWSDDATRIIGLTPTGRATVEALRMNHPLLVSARTIWVTTGYHPPPAP